jgi:LEA14-like dessication related protein
MVFIAVMRSPFLLLGLAVSLILAGCGTPPEKRLDPPGLSVAGIKTTDAGGILTMRFVNANTVPLAVERAVHTVYIGSDRIGRITDTEPFGIPPVGGVTHSVTLPADLAKDVAAYSATHPQATSLVVESVLTLAISGDDTLTLKTSGAGSLK